jgi:hypothetical protein
MRTWRPASRELLAAMLVFVIAGAGLTVARSGLQPHYRLSARQAAAAARTEHTDAEFLAGRRITGSRVIAYDHSMQAVSFFEGQHLVLYALVDPAGRVVTRQVHTGHDPQLGAPLANSWWVLTLTSALFLLAVMVVPLRRIRNLDALALAAFTGNIAAVNAGLVSLSVLLSVVLLAYLALRCLAVGLRERAQPEQTPLFDWLTARWERPERLRAAGLLAAAALAALLMMTLTSANVSTVAAASLSGATDLLHWTLPYGHVHFVVHGDTYPLLNYVFYLPGAVLTPVSDPFSSMAGALYVAAGAALLTAAAMWRLARRVLGADRVAGARAVLAWAAFPPVLVTATGGTDDLVVAACLAWMLVLLTSASRSLLLLTVAAWTKVVPIVLAPLWLVRGEGERARHALPAIVLSLALCAYLVVLGGAGAPGTMLADIWFPFHRGSLYAPWYTFSVEWLQPLVEAAVLALLAWLLLRLRRAPSPWRDPARSAGILGAILLGVQLGANQWTFTYLAWVFPFIALALLLDRGAPRAGSATGGAEQAVDVLAPTGERELQPA